MWSAPPRGTPRTWSTARVEQPARGAIPRVEHASTEPDVVVTQCLHIFELRQVVRLFHRWRPRERVLTVIAVTPQEQWFAVEQNARPVINQRPCEQSRYTD